MKFTNETKSTHEKLSKASARFLEFVERNPGAIKRSGFDLLEGKDEVGKLQSWPTFIDRFTKNQMEKAAKSVFNLFKLIPKRIFANDPYRVSGFYEIPVDIARMQLDGANDGHIDNLLARGDFIYSPAGFKCLEYNVSAMVGGMQVAYWEPMYAGIPVISKFLQENRLKIRNKNLLAVLLEHLLDNAVKKFSNNSSEINIALAIPKYGESLDKSTENKYLNQIYMNILTGKYKSKCGKGEVIFCDYPHLDTADECLFYKGKRIHVLVEMYHGVVPGEIWQVFKKGNLSIYNGPITKLMSSKLNLALLSQHENSDIFSPREREAIKKYIPWTRKTIAGEVNYGTDKVKLEEFVFANKERLVLKPCMGISGAGIHIGKNTPAEQWKKIVDQVFKEKNWVVQEYVESFSFVYQRGETGCAQHIVAWGLFVFGSHYGGAWARVLPTENKYGVVNSIQGAEESVILEVEE